MTDDLEPRQGENEDALWEAVRRLEERTVTAGENTFGTAGETTDLSRWE